MCLIHDSGYDSEDEEEKGGEGDQKQKREKEEVEEKVDLDYTLEWADDEQQEEVPQCPLSPLRFTFWRSFDFMISYCVIMCCSLR